MAFTPIYYLTIACPTLERTMAMAEEYYAHGAHAFQFDFPSRVPTLEPPLVQEMMAKALAASDGYGVYLDALVTLKRRRPEAELHLVVYPDVVESIGFAQKLDYLRTHGVSARFYSVEGIADADMMAEVRAAGAQGALVGNVLMQLWDTASGPWQMLDTFQALAVR